MSRRFQGGESSEILSQNSVKNEDMFQCRHEVGTVNDSDKAVPLSVIQSCPVATCETAGGTAAKVGVVNNFSDFTLLNGREVLVYFASGNTADNPTFNLNNTGAFPLALENQLPTVSIGSGCWGGGVFLHLKYVDITVSNTRIQKWIICGHRIASQSSTQTTYADGQGRTNIVVSGNMQSVTSNAVKNELNTNYKRVISVVATQQPDYITRYGISALLTGNCKLSIDIFTVIDGNKESVAKVMITRYLDYKVYLHIVYNSNEAYPITLENGKLIVGNGKSLTYGGNAFVTYL